MESLTGRLTGSAGESLTSAYQSGLDMPSVAASRHLNGLHAAPAGADEPPVAYPAAFSLLAVRCGLHDQSGLKPPSDE
jgi:hypothetical protein